MKADKLKDWTEEDFHNEREELKLKQSSGYFGNDYVYCLENWIMLYNIWSHSTEDPKFKEKLQSDLAGFHTAIDIYYDEVKHTGDRVEAARRIRKSKLYGAAAILEKFFINKETNDV